MTVCMYRDIHTLQPYIINLLFLEPSGNCGTVVGYLRVVHIHPLLYTFTVKIYNQC